MQILISAIDNPSKYKNQLLNANVICKGKMMYNFT